MAENHLGSRWAPRGPVAIQENRFATRANTSYTSGARRLGESAVLVQKNRRPQAFYTVLLTIGMRPRAGWSQKPKNDTFLRLQKWAFRLRVVQISRKYQKRGFKNVHGAKARAQQQKGCFCGTARCWGETHIFVENIHGAWAKRTASSLRTTLIIIFKKQ